MIDFNECVQKGLLQKIPASMQKAIQSIEKAFNESSGKNRKIAAIFLNNKATPKK